LGLSQFMAHYGVEGDVGAVLDLYFRQCSVLVTARDLAVMAATLANSGVNPVTGEAVMQPYTVARTLSIMTGSGICSSSGGCFPSHHARRARAGIHTRTRGNLPRRSR